MTFEFHELKSLQQMFNLMQEVNHRMINLERMITEKEGKSYLTTAQVALEMGVAENTVLNWAKVGRRHPGKRISVLLKSFKLEGGQYRFSRKDLEEFQEMFTIKK